MEIVVAEEILAVEILLIHHIYQMESWIISNTLVIDGLNALLLGMETYSVVNPMQTPMISLWVSTLGANLGISNGVRYWVYARGNSNLLM